MLSFLVHGSSYLYSMNEGSPEYMRPRGGKRLPCLKYWLICTLSFQEIYQKTSTALTTALDVSVI